MGECGGCCGHSLVPSASQCLPVSPGTSTQPTSSSPSALCPLGQAGAAPQGWVQVPPVAPPKARGGRGLAPGEAAAVAAGMGAAAAPHSQRFRPGTQPDLGPAHFSTWPLLKAPLPPRKTPGPARPLGLGQARCPRDGAGMAGEELLALKHRERSGQDTQATPRPVVRCRKSQLCYTESVR